MQRVSREYSVRKDAIVERSTSQTWRDGALPPPPPYDLMIKPSSVPCEPAKPWDSQHSDGEDSDEGVVEIIMEPHESDSEDTESECTTEIYVPRPGVHAPSAKRVLQSSRTMNEVIPSVSSDNINRAGKLSTALTSEDIATNIDSGISNETSNTRSHEGTVIGPNRPLSVSSSSHYSSSYSCGSRGDIPEPMLGHSRFNEVTMYMKEAKVSRVVSFLSVLYASIIVLLGVIFTVFALEGNFLETFTFEGFYIYMYGLGLLFLLYVYAIVWQRSKHLSKRKKQHLANKVCPGQSCDRCDIDSSVGNLFLRITAVLLCVGGVLDNGLKFGVHVKGSCGRDLLAAIQPAAQLLFMIAEIYFIFANAKMCIKRYPIVAKFGIMHLIATNISVWTLSTLTEIYTSLPSRKRAELLPFYSNQSNEMDVAGGSAISSTKELYAYSFSNCTQSSIIVSMTHKAKPYTYPCTTQFAFLASCVLYVMWKRIDSDSDNRCSECKENTKQTQKSATRTIDCSNTSRGLFLGVASLVACVGCLVGFFVLTSQNYQSGTAALVIHIYKISMYFIMTIVTVVVILKLHQLDFNSCRLTHLEDLILTVCAIAIFSYNVLGIICGIMQLHKLKGLLVLSTSIVELVQSVIQMAALVMGLKLCTADAEEQPKKEGREWVTFLIVANISLWAMSLFSQVLTQGFQVNTLIVGQLSWNTLSNLISPFVIFYYLFSASSYIDIWYHAYRLPTAPIVQV